VEAASENTILLAANIDEHSKETIIYLVSNELQQIILETC